MKCVSMTRRGRFIGHGSPSTYPGYFLIFVKMRPIGHPTIHPDYERYFQHQ